MHYGVSGSKLTLPAFECLSPDTSIWVFGFFLFFWFFFLKKSREIEKFINKNTAVVIIKTPRFQNLDFGVFEVFEFFFSDLEVVLPVLAVLAFEAVLERGARLGPVDTMQSNTQA